MIYKKYAIEITYDENVVENIINNSNSSYSNQFGFSFSVLHKTSKTVIYLDKQGNVSSYPQLYDFYEEAYHYLELNYYQTSYINGMNLMNRVVKIVEVYHDIPIPVLRNRKYKIAKLKGKKIDFHNF
jgi:hypothetical protein